MMHGLYAILDVDAWRARGVDLSVHLEAIAEALLACAPAAIQLRAKHESGASTLALLRRLGPLARRRAVPLFANDRVDLALLAGTDGVHVGQDDLALDDVRTLAPHLQVGVSTHDAAQIERALAARPSYVAFGPVYGTVSKERPDPVVGLDGLRDAAARARDAALPLVAIGGIDRDRAAPVAAAGARCVAVISDLVAASGDRPDLDEVERRARALNEAVRSRS